MMYVEYIQKEWDCTDEVYSPIITFYSASKATKVFTGTFNSYCFVYFQSV